MGAATPSGNGNEASKNTLGDILYPDRSKTPPAEQSWVELVSKIGAGDQPALQALYDRASPPVFTLVLRLCASRETAEEITLDVFHEIWRRAAAYDPADGTVLGWVMNVARSRAIDRIRFERRKKRDGGAQPADELEPAIEVLQQRHDRIALQAALRRVSGAERHAIELAFFSGLTHVEIAERLAEPLGTVKTRIRSGLQNLRGALSEGKER